MSQNERDAVRDVVNGVLENPADESRVRKLAWLVGWGCANRSLDDLGNHKSLLYEARSQLRKKEREDPAVWSAEGACHALYELCAGYLTQVSSDAAQETIETCLSKKLNREILSSLFQAQAGSPENALGKFKGMLPSELAEYLQRDIADVSRALRELRLASLVTDAKGSPDARRRPYQLTLLGQSTYEREVAAVGTGEESVGKDSSRTDSGESRPPAATTAQSRDPVAEESLRTMGEVDVDAPRPRKARRRRPAESPHAVSEVTVDALREVFKHLFDFDEGEGEGISLSPEDLEDEEDRIGLTREHLELLERLSPGLRGRFNPKPQSGRMERLFAALETPMLVEEPDPRAKEIHRWRADAVRIRNLAERVEKYLATGQEFIPLDRQDAEVMERREPWLCQGNFEPRRLELAWLQFPLLVAGKVAKHNGALMRLIFLLNKKLQTTERK